MEKTTIYIHKEKDEEKIYCECGEHRVIAFINGTKDITKIIKDLIKNQHQP